MVGVVGIKPTLAESKSAVLSLNDTPKNVYLYLMQLSKKVVPSGLEPETYGVETRCSIQLSYET
jgi:hypothetical protein